MTTLKSHLMNGNNIPSFIKDAQILLIVLVTRTTVAKALNKLVLQFLHPKSAFLNWILWQLLITVRYSKGRPTVLRLKLVKLDLLGHVSLIQVTLPLLIKMLCFKNKNETGLVGWGGSQRRTGGHFRIFLFCLPWGHPEPKLEAESESR